MNKQWVVNFWEERAISSINQITQPDRFVSCCDSGECVSIQREGQLSDGTFRVLKELHLGSPLRLVRNRAYAMLARHDLEAIARDPEVDFLPQPGHARKIQKWCDRPQQ